MPRTFVVAELPPPARAPSRRLGHRRHRDIICPPADIVAARGVSATIGPRETDRCRRGQRSYNTGRAGAYGGRAEAGSRDTGILPVPTG
jgi:hypothetical protein